MLFAASEFVTMNTRGYPNNNLAPDFESAMKKISRILGYVITIVALLYIVNTIAQFDFGACTFKNPFLSLAYIALFGIWASFFLFAGAYNWKLILEFVSGTSISTRDVFRVYLKSNVAKYLPGNIMNYAGRNYLGRKLGWKNSDMGLSSLLELLFGIAITGTIIIFLIAIGVINLPSHALIKINVNKILNCSLSGIIFGLILLVFYGLWSHFFLKQRGGFFAKRLLGKSRIFFSRKFLLLFVKMLLISFVCFFLNSLTYMYLCNFVLDFHIKFIDIFNMNAALSIANYASVLTPGMPSGFGVKESVSFLMMIGYGYPKESLMISIIIYRIICIIGDVVPFFLVIRR